jgi:hypothetical protein
LVGSGLSSNREDLLPAALDPLLELRTLDTDRRGRSVAREHNSFVVEGEEFRLDRLDDRPEVAVLESCCTGTAGEQGVTGEYYAVEQDAHGPRRVARCVENGGGCASDGEHALGNIEVEWFVSHCAVRRVESRWNTKSRRRIWDRLMVIPVPVGGQDPFDFGSVRQPNDRIGVISGIDDHTRGCGVISDQVDVVVDRADDDARDGEPVSDE